MARQYEMDMTSGSVLKKLLIFTLPLMLSGLLQLLFNAADIVVVGKFAGDNSLAAVGSNAPLVNLLTNLFIGLSVGANVAAAKANGAGHSETLSKTVHTAMLLGLCSGLLLTVVGIVFAPQLLTMMKTPKEVLGLAVIYLRVFFVGMPAMMVYNFGAALLRAIGDTKRPMYFLIISGIVNVLLNLLFVIVFKMDVAGVALATVIAQYISAGLVVMCLMHEQGAIRFSLSQLRFERAPFLEILKIGLPAGFQGVVFALSNVVIQSSVNIFGETVMAGNSAAASIEGFIYMAMNSFYQAAISFTGQNFGAKKPERLPRIFLCAEGCVIATGLIFGQTAYLLSEPLLGLYTDSPEVVAAGMNRLSVIACTYALCGMMDVAVGVLRGLGCSVTPMIVSLAGACGFRIVWIATVFQMKEHHNILTVYLSYPISWIITFTAHMICFFFVWRKVKKQLLEEVAQ